MLSCAEVTCPSITCRSRAPSPSTRVSRSTRMVLVAMGLALAHEWRCGGIEAAKSALEVAGRGAQRAPLARERRGVRTFHRAVAAVAAAPECGADRPAARVRDGTQARDALHHHAHRAAELAIDANAVRGHGRFAAGQEGADDLEQLHLVDR